MTESTWQAAFDIRKAEWSSHIRAVKGSRVYGYGHFRHTVEILSGDPPDQALLDCANDWQFALWGGVVDYRFAAEDEGGQTHRYVAVKVYTD